MLAGIVGLIDVSVRGERILWANLAVRPLLLFGIYSAAAIPAELLLRFVLR